MYHIPPARAWWTAGRSIGKGGGVANLEPGTDRANSKVARAFMCSPGPEIQIVSTILRPSTMSEMPNGGFGGTDFRVLPALWLLWALPPGLSWVIGAWVIGAWVDGTWVKGVCAWERVPALAWAWASAYCF